MTTSSLCGKPHDDESRKSWTNKDWYTHVGAWENEQGQLCFGSTIAFSAMLQQFHRVWTAVPQPSSVCDVQIMKCAICNELGDQCMECEESGFVAWADRYFASVDYRKTAAGVYIQDWMRHAFAAWQARRANGMARDQQIAESNRIAAALALLSPEYAYTFQSILQLQRALIKALTA